MKIHTDENHKYQDKYEYVIYKLRKPPMFFRVKGIMCCWAVLVPIYPKQKKAETISAREKVFTDKGRHLRY